MDDQSIIAAMLTDGPLPKRYRRSHILLGTAISSATGVAFPAVLSYGKHFPLAVHVCTGEVWYNEDRWGAITAGHQSAIRRQLQDAGYRATQTTREFRFVGANTYTYRSYLPVAAVAGWSKCTHCRGDGEPIFYYSTKDMYDHLRTAHPRKAKQEAADYLAVYGPF